MFSKEKVNIGRQKELDIARGLAVLFMILIHVQLYFASKGVMNTYFADFNDFVGDMPAAPMFMFLLGIGINYSKKTTPKSMLKRGMILLLLGYVLSFVRGFIPNIINAYTFGDLGYIYQGIYELMFIDILQFSGLAMIMFSLFFKFKLRKRTIAIIGVVLAILNLFMLNIKIDNFWITSFTGLFWGSGEDSFFPFLTWVFYPIAGLLFGSFLIRCTNKRKFYIISGLVSTIIFFSGIVIFNIILKIPTGLNSELGYYQHFITDNITFTAFVILEISILSFIVNLIPNFLTNIAGRWSKNVTSIYCISWGIITWTVLVIPSNSLSMGPFIIYIIITIVLSDFLAYIYTKIKRGMLNKKRSENLT